MATSRGAWPHFYTLGLDYRSNPQGREAFGIYAFKNELIYNGFSRGINPDTAYWGSKVVNRTKDAQRHFGLTVDGVLGPTTARYLFRKRILEQVNADALSRIKTLESGNDPVAQGVADLDDEGLFQENGPSNPDLTKEQCWTPSFIIPHAASQLASRIRNCGNSEKAGIAAWNVGNTYANDWRLAGFPASGKIVTVGGSSFDVYTRATHYYTLVMAQEL
jgi:peptidoglycan hydrolase-like protein with peptidoglycan-binding domain